MIKATALAASGTSLQVQIAEGGVRNKGRAIVLAVDPEMRWATVREHVALATKFAHGQLACQVVAGMELAALKKEFGISAGRPSTKLPHGAVIKIPHWDDLVKERAGISDDTARRWIAMAEGIKKKWKNLPSASLLRMLVQSPPSQWSDDDTKAIFTALHKCTDGLTQMEFMLDIGVAKKPSGGKGGAHGGGKKKLSLEEATEVKRQLASTDFAEAAQILDDLRESFTLLTDDEITAQIAALERSIKARLKWLSKPAAKRTIDEVAEFFKS